MERCESHSHRARAGRSGGEEPGPLPSTHPASLGQEAKSRHILSPKTEARLLQVRPSAPLPFVHSATSLSPQVSDFFLLTTGAKFLNSLSQKNNNHSRYRH